MEEVPDEPAELSQGVRGDVGVWESPVWILVLEARERWVGAGSAETSQCEEYSIVFTEMLSRSSS